MQEDTKISKKTTPMQLHGKSELMNRKNRIWERPKTEDILIEAKKEIDK